LRNTGSALIGLGYIKHFIGLPYAWSGDDSIAGFDCSGLVVEFLQCVGLIAEKSDYTADDLFRMYKVNKIDHGVPGALVFYGENKAGHVGICINDRFMIEAGGGGEKTKTRQDAIDQNAFVRIRLIRSRRNILGFCDPFLQE
jgi:cell wall-associated NlpC family hydrolase